MAQPGLFSWSPYLALALGALAGLGALRSWRLVSVLAGAGLALQLVAWPALFFAADVADRGWDENWQAALEVGFFGALFVAVPYTVIAAVPVASLLRLVCGTKDRRSTIPPKGGTTNNEGPYS
jgi:hypothetical protein